jgi:type II secretory pathway component HofQ
MQKAGFPKDIPIPDSIIIPEIDFDNQPIQDVLRLLSAPYGINLMVDPGLKANVTLRLTDIKLRDAVLFIINENGFDFDVTNNIIKVFKPAPLPPPPPPEPEKTPCVFEVVKGLLTIDVSNMPLDSIARWATERAKMNIVAEKGLEAKVSGFLRDLPVEEALKIFFENNALQMAEKDGIYYVFPAG